MYAERHVVSITTNASGDGTGYTPTVTGRILSVIYTPDSTNPYAGGANITVTLEATGETILGSQAVSAAFTKYPRPITHNPSTWAEADYRGEQTIVAANDRVKIVVSGGGANKTGRFDIVVG